MAANQIRFQIEGFAADNGDVRLDDFILELENIKHALGDIERIVAGSENVLNYRIFELSHQKPFLIGLEIDSDTRNAADEKTAGEVVNTLIKSIGQIYYQNQAPAGFDFEAYQALKQLTSMVGEKFASLRISNSMPDDEIFLTSPLGPKIENILGPDRVSFGSVTGKLELANLNYPEKMFSVNPTVGKGRVKCYFPEGLFGEALNALGKSVKIYGKQKTKKGNYRPYEILVSKFEVFPPENELPKLMDLKGIDPGLIGDGNSSEQFIREIRNEW